MKNAVSIFFFLFAGIYISIGQEVKYTVLPVQIVDGDTLPFVRLKEVEVYSLKIPKRRKDQKRLDRKSVV